MIKEEIAFDDFKKVDIRVGKILSAEVVPDADKLLVLSVDFGPQPKEDSSEEEEEQERHIRQIVSGIREYVEDPEALIGMSTTFVLNLPPRTIRGYESQGMLFAVGGEVGFSFLLPQNQDTAPGSPLI